LGNGRLFKMAPVPQGARPELIEGLMVQAHHTVRGRVPGTAILKLAEGDLNLCHRPIVAQAGKISERQTRKAYSEPEPD